MLFSYTAYDSAGKASRGTIDAPDERDAGARLLQRGLFVRSIKPAEGPSKAPAPAVRAIVYRELAALLQAGLTMENALELLAEQIPEASGALLCVAASIRGGKSFADALLESVGTLAAAESAAVRAAEKAGSLPEMLLRLSKRLEDAQEARSKVRSALVYPMFVVGLGIIVAAVMLGVIVPRTTAIMTASGMELPNSSKMLVSLARAFVLVALPTILAVLAAYGLARARAQRDARFAIRFDRALLGARGALYWRLQTAEIFADTLAMLCKGGMPVADALGVAASATGRPSVAADVAEAVRRVRSGIALPQALADVPHLGKELVHWIRIGDAGGCLPAMLEEAARRICSTRSRILTARLALLEPLLLAAVGLFVLVLSLALLLPVISIATDLG